MLRFCNVGSFPQSPPPKPKDERIEPKIGIAGSTVIDVYPGDGDRRFTTRTYTVKVTLKNPPPQLRFGMSIGGRWSANSGPVVALPLSALFEQNGTPAVWVVDERSGSVALRPVTVARYETDRVVIADGLAKGDVVVTAGANTLRKVRRSELPQTLMSGSISK